MLGHFSQAIVSGVGLCEQSTLGPWPCISINNPSGAAIATSQRFDARHTITPSHSTTMCRLVQAVCFYSMQPNQLLSIRQTIQHPLPSAALPTAHVAVQGGFIVAGCPDPQIGHVLCARLVGAIVEELLLAVAGMVQTCCRANPLVASPRGCATVLPALPPCYCRRLPRAMCLNLFPCRESRGLLFWFMIDVSASGMFAAAFVLSLLCINAYVKRGHCGSHHLLQGAQLCRGGAGLI